MLDWHYNHCVFEVGGPALIRQHAAALLVALVASGESGVCDMEAQKLLLEPLHNCCCNWMHKATRGGDGAPKDVSDTHSYVLCDVIIEVEEAWEVRLKCVSNCI